MRIADPEEGPFDLDWEVDGTAGPDVLDIQRTGSLGVTECFELDAANAVGLPNTAAPER
jgi:hypothetical protein